MTAPTQYFVSWEDPALVRDYVDGKRHAGVDEDTALACLDPALVESRRDFESLPVARRFAKKVNGVVFERANRRPDPSTGGLDWEWNEREVE